MNWIESIPKWLLSAAFALLVLLLIILFFSGKELRYKDGISFRAASPEANSVEAGRGWEEVTIEGPEMAFKYFKLNHEYYFTYKVGKTEVTAKVVNWTYNNLTAVVGDTETLTITANEKSKINRSQRGKSAGSHDTIGIWHRKLGNN